MQSVACDDRRFAFRLDVAGVLGQQGKMGVDRETQSEPRLTQAGMVKKAVQLDAQLDAFLAP